MENAACAHDLLFAFYLYEITIGMLHISVRAVSFTISHNGAQLAQEKRRL